MGLSCVVVGGLVGGQTKMKLVLISTQVEVGVELGNYWTLKNRS